MAKTMKTRRRYDDAFKKKVLAEVAKAGKASAIAKKYNLSSSLVSTWKRDPSLRVATLPQKPKVMKVRRQTKKIIPTGFKCPHCEGPLEVSA